jgi:type I restriction enzyme S subunit
MNTIALVGEAGYVDKDYPELFLPDRLWLASENHANLADMRWLAYILSSEQYRDQLRDLATGTSGSMKNISRSTFLNISVHFPKLEEQRAIVNVLAEADLEIDAYHTRLEKSKAVKQGMMQQLLTGRTRLLV